MKRILTTMLVAPTLVLAACGGDDDDGDGDTATTSGDITITGEFGEKPTLEIPSGEPSDELQIDVLSEGDGPEVGADDFVVADYLGQTWKPRDPADIPSNEAPPATEDSGTAGPTPESTEEGGDPEPYVFDNSYDRGQVAGFSLSQVIPGWKDGLAGQKVGSRVLLTVPPAMGYGQPEGEENSAEAQPHDLAEDTLVFVVDIVDSVAPDAAATGEPASDLPEGIPSVESGETGVPTIDFEGAKAPETSDSTIILKGDGPALGENVVAQLMEAPYPDGEGAQSTWEQGGPQLIPATGLESLPGWSDISEGLTAGSRVLVRISAEDAAAQGAGGEGDEASALVLLVDFISTY